MNFPRLIPDPSQTLPTRPPPNGPTHPPTQIRNVACGENGNLLKGPEIGGRFEVHQI